MKKKLLISLMVALVMVLVPSSVAFAGEYYDIEDPCVADSEDFIWGVGWDGSSAESYYGGQSWSYYPTPSDGYNLYRDDATDTGNLDEINDLITRTPDAIEGLSIEWAFPELDGGFWYMGDESLDTWYWALEPRGYNIVREQEELPYLGLEGKFTVEVFKYRYHDSYSWAGRWNELPQVLGEAVSITGVSNGTTCNLEIPEGTQVSFPYRPGVLVTFLSVSIVDGEVSFSTKNMDFSEPCTLTFTTPAGTEVITFTQIRDGLPVE